MNNDIEILRKEIFKLSALNHKLQDKLSIALEGLEALISSGDQIGIAKQTLKAIKELDLTQE